MSTHDISDNMAGYAHVPVDKRSSIDQLKGISNALEYGRNGSYS